MDEKCTGLDRRGFLQASALAGVGVVAASMLGGTAARAAETPRKVFKADYSVEATLENVIKGALSPDKKPVLTVESGAVVDIETISMLGVIGSFSEYMQRYSLPKGDPVIAKILAAESMKPTMPGPHVLTGPIYIKGAMPGDTLEVRVLGTELTTGFGNLMTIPGRGGAGDLVKNPDSFRIEYTADKNSARFKNLTVPCNPFFGIMGLAPEKAVSSIPPGPFGGNMDIKAFCTGSSVFLPVQVEGGLYYTGDAHACQGDGEVALTAVETSLKGQIQFILHKGMKLSMPMGETPDAYIATGMNEDLDAAMHQTIAEAARFIAEKNGLTFNEALAACSMAVDFKVAQVVNGVKGVYASIPKAFIGQHKFGGFWNADNSVRYL